MHLNSKEALEIIKLKFMIRKLANCLERTSNIFRCNSTSEEEFESPLQRSRIQVYSCNEESCLLINEI